MKAKSIHGNTTEEVRQALREAMSDGFAPTLAIAFVSIKQDRAAICQVLRQAEIDVLGCTSSGEFTNQAQTSEAAAILLFELDRDCYTILFEQLDLEDPAAGATRLAEVARDRFERPALILCTTSFTRDGEYLNGQAIMQAMEQVLGADTAIYGGMAGDDVTFTGSFVFTADAHSDAGMVALVLDESKIALYGMALSGWNPVGIERTVTACDDSWILTVDDQPALNMYLKYLGMEPVGDVDAYEIFKDIGIYYPLQVRGAGDPVLRTPIMADKERNAIKLDFGIPEGTRFRFSMPPEFDIVENVVEQARKLKHTSDARGEALLIFSCAGRLNALGPMTGIENDGLAETWDAPMAGFFTYGEYGTVNGRQGFHSTTCCWVAIKEKQ